MQGKSPRAQTSLGVHRDGQSCPWAQNFTRLCFTWASPDLRVCIVQWECITLFPTSSSQFRLSSQHDQPLPGPVRQTNFLPTVTQLQIQS